MSGAKRMRPAARADRGAEIDVLRVHEKPLVEAADRLRIRPPHQQARAADPVGVLTLARQGLDRAAAREALLTQLVERPDHAAEGQLGMPGAVHEPRPDDCDVRIAIELGEQPVDRAGWHDGVAVQQEDVRRRGWRGCRCCSRARSRDWPRPRSRVTSGQRRAASALPSVDALSTTRISCGATGGAACSDSRQRSRSARALNDTMMIETIGVKSLVADKDTKDTKAAESSGVVSGFSRTPLSRSRPAFHVPRAASCTWPAPRARRRAPAVAPPRRTAATRARASWPAGRPAGT